MRHFEKISKQQFEKDCDNSEHIYDLYQLPLRATKKSAGYDFFTFVDINLQPGEDVLIPTGVRVIMEDDEVLYFHPRSGQGFKFYIRLANSTGVIDADFCHSENEGHMWIKIRNEGERPFVLNAWNEDGTQNAIAQAVFHKFLLVDGDDFDNGATRIGGIGSTG